MIGREAGCPETGFDNPVKNGEPARCPENPENQFLRKLEKKPAAE